MKTEYHAFVDGDVGRCGAILRHVEHRSLRTRTVFRMGEDAPVYLVDHVVDHDGDVRRWRRFTYDSPGSGSQHSGTRDTDGTVHVDGTVAPELTDAVGGYGEHLVLAQMLGGDEDTVSYVQLDESEPTEEAQKAELHRCGFEATELLDGSTVDAERIQLGGGDADQGVRSATGRGSHRLAEGAGIRRAAPRPRDPRASTATSAAHPSVVPACGRHPPSPAAIRSGLLPTRVP